MEWRDENQAGQGAELGVISLGTQAGNNGGATSMEVPKKIGAFSYSDRVCVLQYLWSQL